MRPSRRRAPRTGRSTTTPNSARRPSRGSRTRGPGRMPNSPTALRLVESAAKCAPTAASPRAPASQSRAARALVMVSSVVKVLDATSTSVRAGLSSRASSAKAWPSTLDRKRARMRGPAASVSASTTMRGPRSEPPMPMLRTVSKLSPVAPRSSPPCTRRTKSRILSRSAPARREASSTPPGSAARMPASAGGAQRHVHGCAPLGRVHHVAGEQARAEARPGRRCARGRARLPASRRRSTISRNRASDPRNWRRTGARAPGRPRTGRGCAARWGGRRGPRCASRPLEGAIRSALRHPSSATRQRAAVPLSGGQFPVTGDCDHGSSVAASQR